MAGIINRNYEKFKREHREELDDIKFGDMIEGFLDRAENLGFITPVVMTRNINGKIIKQVNRGQKKSAIMNKLLRHRNHRVCHHLPMRNITIDDINWLFGSRIELKNYFLDEIYYKYYM